MCSVCLKLLYPDPSWINQPMLFPSWNYMAQNGSGKVGQEAGYLELIASPIHLTPDAVPFDPGGSQLALGVKGAARRLREKWVRGGVKCMMGRASSVDSIRCLCMGSYSSVSVLLFLFTLTSLALKYSFNRVCMLQVDRHVCRYVNRELKADRERFAIIVSNSELTTIK